MPVQAQFPSNGLLSELRKRARPEACDYIADLSFQDGHLHMHNAGINCLPPPAIHSAGMLAENRIPRSSICLRKKSREETMASKQQVSVASLNPMDGDRSCGFMTPVCNVRTCFPSAELSIPQKTDWPFNSEVPDVVGNGRLTPASANYTSRLAANTNTGLICSLLDDATIHMQFCQQEAEIDQIITTHNEQLKHALEEKRQQHSRALLELMDYCVLSSIREKMVEIEKLRHRNLELEDYVNKLSLESQVWMNIAQSQEALVTSLRSNLEQALAQSNEKGKGRFGESDAGDAESCIFGASMAAGGVDLWAEEIRGLKEQRNCRYCKKKPISVLLIPCRHLCLCTDCDPALGNCPVCGISKGASLQVYMDE